MQASKEAQDLDGTQGPEERNDHPLQYSLSFPDGSDGKESAYNPGDLGSKPGLGRPPGDKKGYPLQYSGIENFMNCIVHGVTKSHTRLSNFHCHFTFTASISLNILHTSTNSSL